MSQRNLWSLIGIIALLAVCIWVALPNNPGILGRNLDTQLGLDLRGGLRVLLEVDLPEDRQVSAQEIEDAKNILENRANGLGVSEVMFQVAGSRRLVGEFPGLTNTDEVINVLRETGQLAFVPMGSNPLAEGTVVDVDTTNANKLPSEISPTTAPAVPTAAPTAEATPTATATEAAPPKYSAIMTGDQLSDVGVTTDQLGKYVISFSLKSTGAAIFSDYTTNHVGEYLAIILDNKVISAPRIENAITDGSGIIQGSFTAESANELAVQLRYGSLPVPFKVVESRVVGPSLGQDSLNKSLVAGGIGLIIVILFMVIFYRLPGIAAALAILMFALITFALYKFIPVTLTLPGIAGFLLSTGSALDANILIFERLKEELRAGRNLQTAFSMAWHRAWPAIRDSNIATLIVSAILFWFGSNYGASIVKGFAITLSLGVLISLFTAFVITRTFLAFGLDAFKPKNFTRWFGI